ncbi:MAG: CHAT domain-containing protein, partial [bacterium]
GAHLIVIRDMSFEIYGRGKSDNSAFRLARKTAESGLKIIESNLGLVDPDLHADLLIAKGQARFYEEDSNYYRNEGIQCYHEALKLKRMANNQQDVVRLEAKLWEQTDYHLTNALISMQIGGIGEAIEILKTCLAVLEDLENQDRVLEMKITIAGIFRQVAQYHTAEEILKSLINKTTDHNLLFDVRFELASVYSETSRPLEASKIQKELLAGIGDKDERESVLWSNYANSLMLLDDLKDAEKALKEAWDKLPKEQKQKKGSAIPLEGVRIQTQFAQVALRNGKLSQAIEHIERAEKLHPSPHGLESLHFYDIKAKCLEQQGRTKEAIESLTRAFNQLNFLLSRGPSLESWESLLYRWSHLDDLTVRLYFDDEDSVNYENALLRAEAVKGRVSAWLENFFAPKSAEYALSLDRQEKALEVAKYWLRKKKGRRIISLYNSEEGLSVFNLDERVSVTGKHIEDFNYDDFRDNHYNPWEDMIELTLNELAGEEDLEKVGLMTEDLLDKIGNWLSDACVELNEGGTDLIVIPHRLLRNIPLIHARLPSGKRLSDLFETVMIVPSLGDFARDQRIPKELIISTEINALADPDGTLPFSRAEAYLSGASNGLFIGEAATASNLKEVMSKEGILLLSLHGDFNEKIPFQSTLEFSDGKVHLHELMLEQVRVNCNSMILGACESGKFRRSLSDEPIGFSTIFLQAGVRVVLAPAWRIEDFPTFLFISKLMEGIQEGGEFFPLSRETAIWLRELTKQEALNRVDLLSEKVLKNAHDDKEFIMKYKEYVGLQKQWLENLPRDKKPFDSLLDWAGFQLICSAPQ